MEKSNTEKSRKMSQASGIAFALALFAVAVLLFLFSDIGESVCAELGISQTVYEPVPAKTATPSKAPEKAETGSKCELSPDVFFSRAKEYGAQFTHTLAHKELRSEEYALSGDFSLTAKLMLSLHDGNVNELILVCDVPEEPGPLPPDAGTILNSLHSKDIQRYETDVEWIISAVTACTLALDTEESVSYSDTLTVEETIRSALENSEACKVPLGGFTLDFRPDGQGCLCVTVRTAE